ncbi:hypothetical protein AB0H88_35460 [Nonomuraea sp. NPDC050680]|uniref:hypothetical protein n=1 Tax=Nonomuraea sp. NPDC050680 TaxID=3154630 RepID=UPI0033D79E90
MVGVSLAITVAAGVLARPLAGRVADRAERHTALCAGALLFLPMRHNEHEGAPLDHSPH